MKPAYHNLKQKTLPNSYCGLDYEPVYLTGGGYQCYGWTYCLHSVLTSPIPPRELSGPATRHQTHECPFACQRPLTMFDGKQDQFWLHPSEFSPLISDFRGNDKLNPVDIKGQYSRKHNTATLTFQKNKHYNSSLTPLKFLASSSSSRGSIPDQFMHNLWSIKWCYSRFSLNTSVKGKAAL